MDSASKKHFGFAAMLRFALELLQVIEVEDV
jgi:hypothetical protein